MKNRFISLLLVFSILVSFVPTVCMTVLATETEEPTMITVSFQTADGKIIRETDMEAGYLQLYAPIEAELLAAGMTAEEVDAILGWYYTAPDGKVYDIAAYTSVRLEHDVVFTPYTKELTLEINPTSGAAAVGEPLYDAATGAIVAWQNGYTIGCVTTASPLTSYAPYGQISIGVEHILRKAYEWTEGGVYLQSQNNTGYILPAASTGYMTAISWTAYVGGTIDLSLAVGAKAVKLLVAKNGSIVYPAGAVATDITTWQTTDGTATTLAVATGLTVAAGDELCIIMARADEESLVTPEVTPTITYTAVGEDKWDDIVLGSTTNMKDNQPTVSNKVVTNRGNWSYIYYPGRSSITLENAQVADAYMTIGGTATVTLPEHAGITSGKDAKISVYRGSNATWSANTSKQYAMALLKGRVGGYRYTAEHEGTVDIDFTRLGRFCKTDSIYSTTASNFSFAIYVDGVKVWPVSTSAENSSIDASGWYMLGPEAKKTQKDVTAAANAVDAAARHNIPVKKGSKIDILAVNLYGDVYKGNGLLMFADVTYTGAHIERETSNITNHMPTVSGDKVQFTDEWSLVYYPSVANINEEKRQPVDSIMDIGGYKTYTIAANAGKAGAEKTSIGFFVGSHSYWGADNLGLAVCKSVVAGYAYTAPKSGLVNIDFTKLGRFAVGAADAKGEISFAIYVDGVKVWPVSTSAQNENINANGWFKMACLAEKTNLTTAANGVDVMARRNIFVREGSRIEFLATNTSTSIYAGTGLLMKADVALAEYDYDLTVSASLDGALSMNVSVGNTDAYSNFKVTVNGKKLTDNRGVYAYTDLAAKDIHTKLTYRVTADLVGLRRNCLLAEGELSVAEYMQMLVNNNSLSNEIRSLALAYIQYGEAAMKYFADGELSADDKALIKNPPAVTDSVGLQDACDAPIFGFSAATLLLNDEIDLKLHIDAKNAMADTSAYTLHVTTTDGTVSGSGWTLSPRTGLDGTRYFKAIINGIPVSAFADDLYITVMQGETAVSDTLIYSVDSYISRMYASGSDQAKNLLHRIAALGDTASGETLVCLWSDWELVTAPDFNGEAGLEKRICSICGKEETRVPATLSMTYQEIYDFGTPVLSILNETVTSTVTGTETLDEHVLTIRNDGKLFATGCGTAVVVTAEGSYAVTVKAATINMLFLSGQSNANGAHATSAPVNSADYGKYFLRSPEAMAYLTHAGDSLDVTVEETSGKHPLAYVVKSLKWGDQTRYSTAASSGPASTTLCSPTSTYGSTGVTAGLAYEWIKNTGERVWIVNASHGGQSIQSFVPTDSTGTANVPDLAYSNYEQAIAVYKLALETMQNEVAAGHFTLNHMGFYWLQGESDSSCNDFYYEEQFDRLFTGLQKDVVYDDGASKKTIEFAAILPVRSCKSSSGNTLAEMYMTGSRLAQYYMGADSKQVHENVYLITNVTERWLDTDENVVNYFLERYGSNENFKAIFGYDIPTSRKQVHPDIHYAIYGYNEMGIDAARNTLMILNAQGADYKLSYPELLQSTTIRLVERDGYTPLTSILFDVDASLGYVIPRIEPLYRMAEGVTFVSETSGFTFDGFRLSYEGENMPKEIIFSVYVGETWLQRYQLPLTPASVMQMSGDKFHVEDGTGTRKYLYSDLSDVWQNGWIEYATGTFHPYTKTAASGWRLDQNDTLWAAPFHGAELRSHGIALGNVSGASGSAIRYIVKQDGYIRPRFDSFSAGDHDSHLAIIANGRLVWPQNTNAIDYEDTTNWFHIYNGGEGETRTTTAMLNTAVADLCFKVEAGDEIVFALEYVNGVTNMSVMPAFLYVEEKDATGAIVVDQTPYEGPINFANVAGSLDPANNTTPWSIGYVTYATNTFTPFTAKNSGWWYDGKNLWGGSSHGAFLTDGFLTAPSSGSGHDIGIRYIAEKAGTVALGVSSIAISTYGDTDFAIFVKRNGTYTPLWPAGATVTNGKPDGWYRLYNGKDDGENAAATKASVNAAMAGLTVEVEAGDEIVYLFGYVDSATSRAKCYPLIAYK